MDLRRLAVAAVACLVVSVAAFAQEGRAGRSEPAISASGSEVVEVVPNIIGMRLKLESAGPDPEAALADIQKKIESIRTSLEAMEPSKPEVTVDGPVPVGDFSSDISQIIEGIRNRLGAEGAKTAEDAKKSLPPMKVEAEITAEWPLKDADTFGKVRSALAIRAAVREILSKVAEEKKELTEEEEEMMLAADDDEDGPPAGTPFFYFVAMISPEQRKEAQSKALAKAQAGAKDLAELAGVKLGPLSHLSSNLSAEDAISDIYGYETRRWISGSNYYDEEEDDRAVSSNLTKASFIVAVYVNYGMGAAE